MLCELPVFFSFKLFFAVQKKETKMLFVILKKTRANLMKSGAPFPA